MSAARKELAAFPWHPLLFGLFPLLTLFGHNMSMLSLGALARPLGVTVASVVVVTLLLVAILRNIRKAALVSSLIVVPFFSAGHVERLIGHGAGALIYYLAWLVALIAAFVKLRRSSSDLRAITRLLNVVGAVLVIMPVVQIGAREIRYKHADVTYEVPGGVLETSKLTDLPNIYYIVMDGYAREDVLEYLFKYDNSEFIDFLKDRGFYVADESRSNYIQTHQSLMSALDMNYLDKVFGGDFRGAGDDRDPLKEGYRHNRVTKLLRLVGYRYVTFETWSGVNPAGADIALGPGSFFNLFDTELINTTPLAAALASLPAVDPYAEHRRRILYTLEHLPDTASLRPPIFVYAHIFAPHPPFVFDAEGQPVRVGREFFVGDATHYYERGGTVKEYLAGYPGQLTFVNHKLMEAIDDILQRSEHPPIIVVQGDHGSRMLVDWSSLERTNTRECFPILNAYYMPGDEPAPLYPDITPVNTFRTIFNHYFGAHFDHLPDHSFYSEWEHAYTWTEVPESETLPHKGAYGKDLQRVVTTRFKHY